MKNKYYKIYRNIIYNSKKLNRKKSKSHYYESHHIVPISLGGSDKSHNKVFLTAREHFIVHACLPRFLSGTSKYSMIYAFDMMNKTSNNQNRYMNSRLFEENKKKLSIIRSESMTGEKHWSYGIDVHPLLGRKYSTEHKKSISNGLTGRTFSEEHRKKLGLRQLGNKNHMFGKQHKQSSKNLVSEKNSHRSFIFKDGITKRIKNVNILEWLFNGWVIKHPSKGKTPKKKKCPHCFKELDISNAKRWHFDNCKKRNVDAI